MITLTTDNVLVVIFFLILLRIAFILYKLTN